VRLPGRQGLGTAFGSTNRNMKAGMGPEVNQDPYRPLAGAAGRTKGDR
jgi:hypothetical protein